MRLFEFLKRTDMNEGIKNYKRTENAVLLDVRTEEEYWEGRIPESKNLPLQRIQTASEIFPDPDQPIFVYCHSGVRSRQAAFLLKAAGFTDVTDLGGILDYKGEILQGSC